MAVEDLVFPLFPSKFDRQEETELVMSLRGLKDMVGYLTDRQGLYDATKEMIRGIGGLHRTIEERFIARDKGKGFSELSGLLFPGNKAASEKQGLKYAGQTSHSAAYAIGNVSLANRVTPDGTIVNHVVMTIVQKRGVRFHVEGRNISVDESGFFVPEDTEPEDRGEHHIIFRGGCTLIFDLDALRLRYAVKKDIDDRGRMIRQFQFEQGLLGEDDQTYFDSKTLTALAGPFAFTHSHNATHGERL